MSNDARISLRDPEKLSFDVYDSLRHDMVGLAEDIFFLAGIKKQEIIGSEYSDVEELGLWDDLSAPSKSKINSINKVDLVDWVTRASKLFIERAYPAMKKTFVAAKRCGEMEMKCFAHQEEVISTQRALVAAQAELLKLQAQLLEKREEVITDVQTAAKEEILSFSSVLKEQCDTALAPHRIERAVAKAAVTVAEDRTCNIVVYGLKDSPGAAEEQLSEMWSELSEKPFVKCAQRLGRYSEDRSRPLKITFSTRETQLQILRKKTKLRDSEVFGRVYISPDLTPEEREARGILVKELKERKAQNPGKSYVIRGREVVEVSPERQ